MEIGGGAFMMPTLYMISDIEYLASGQEWVKKMEFLYFCLSGFSFFFCFEKELYMKVFWYGI